MWNAPCLIVGGKFHQPFFVFLQLLLIKHTNKFSVTSAWTFIIFLKFLFSFVSLVQSLSCVQLFATPWTAAHQPPLSFLISWSLLKFMSTESVMPSNHLILCRPLLLSPSIFPSIRVFSNESPLHFKWPKYWSFSISPSSEYSGLISFRIDWFDLLAVQGTLKSLRQHYSPKTSILQCSAFFMVQLSHPYMTTGKTIALTIQTFVSKLMSLLFNTLCKFVIAFLPRRGSIWEPFIHLTPCFLLSLYCLFANLVVNPHKQKWMQISTILLTRLQNRTLLCVLSQVLLGFSKLLAIFWTIISFQLYK